MTKNFKLMIALGAAVATGSGATAMLLGGGGGESWFGEPKAYIAEHSVGAGGLIAFDDFNNDGYADYADFDWEMIADVVHISVNQYMGYGDGNWVLEGTYGLGGVEVIGGFYGYSGHRMADVNGDGYLDVILIAEQSANKAVIFRNGNGFVCAGDINGNGETEIDDLLQLISDFGCTEGDPLN